MSVTAFEHITVATDESPASKAATRYAHELAQAGVALEFCSVEQHTSHLHAAEAIAACAVTNASEAIVIGSGARGGIAHVLGSVAESLMRIADRPIIFIHETDEFRGGDIAVTIGGFDTSHRVLDAAIAMALTLKRNLFLMEEVTVPIGVDYYAPGTNSDAHLVAAAERASAAGVKSRATIGDGVGSKASALVELAKRHDCALIVTGFHDRSALARFFTGSIAEDIVLEAHLPVAVIHHPFQPASP